MFWAAAHGLHRGPHVTFSRQQIPAGGQEIGSFNPPTFINRQRSPAAAIPQDLWPYHVSVTLDHRMRAAQFMGFVRVEGCMNSTEDHIRTPITGHLSNFVPAESIRR